MRHSGKILAAVSAMVLFGALPAMAQTSCPDYGVTSISTLLYDGKIMMGHTKSTTDIARKKKLERNRSDMPIRQGNIGAATFRVETTVGMETHPDDGCVFVRDISIDLYLDYRIDLAKEYAEGTCMYDEFYNLEMELMAQDEEMANEELQKLRALLKDRVGGSNVFSPRGGQDIDIASQERKKEIETLIEGYLKVASGTLAEARSKSDEPGFFAEIETLCSGDE